jgi:hypothetical protein
MPLSFHKNADNVQSGFAGSKYQYPSSRIYIPGEPIDSKQARDAGMGEILQLEGPCQQCGGKVKKGCNKRYFSFASAEVSLSRRHCGSCLSPPLINPVLTAEKIPWDNT